MYTRLLYTLVEYLDVESLFHRRTVLGGASLLQGQCLRADSGPKRTASILFYSWSTCLRRKGTFMIRDMYPYRIYHFCGVQWPYILLRHGADPTLCTLICHAMPCPLRGIFGTDTQLI